MSLFTGTTTRKKITAAVARNRIRASNTSPYRNTASEIVTFHVATLALSPGMASSGMTIPVVNAVTTARNAAPMATAIARSMTFPRRMNALKSRSMRERIRMADDRLVMLEGALNFRDLGGYVGRDGRTVRWGRVYRSDALHALTERDLATIAELGLRSVFDLRWSHERERQPTAIPTSDGMRSGHLMVGGDPDLTNSKELMEQILDGSLPEADDGFMAQMYADMLRDGATTFGRLLTHLAEDDWLPALFHCTAGKDRTGISAALLLSVLGVDDETILDGYELSTKYRSNTRIEELRPTLEAAGVDVEKVRPFLSARRPVMEATLAHLRDDHGGVEQYVLGPAGVAEATLDRLRELLLD